MSSSGSTARILIKGGKVVNDDFTQEADVYIENGVIQQVGKELMIPGGAKVIDASGKLVMPGGVDTCVHLNQSFMNATPADDFYSGTKVGTFTCPFQGCSVGAFVHARTVLTETVNGQTVEKINLVSFQQSKAMNSTPQCPLPICSSANQCDIDMVSIQ